MKHPRSILALTLAMCLLALTSCAYHPPVQQGNILTNQDISAIHRGMTKDSVQKILGTPVLTNLYQDGKLVYIYTFMPSHGSIQKRQLLIYFQDGRVVDFQVVSSPNLKPPL